MHFPWWKPSKSPPEIPESLRAEFEELGESVVSQIVGRPYTTTEAAAADLALMRGRVKGTAARHAAGSTWGVPQWAGNEEARQHALFWLSEKRRRANCKQWIGWGIGWGLSLIVIGIALYNVFISKQADRPELISTDARLFISRQALPYEAVTIGWVNIGKRPALRGTATLYSVSKDGSRYQKFGYSGITNGPNSSIRTIAPSGLGSIPYAQFPIDMKKFLGLFLVCTKYRDDSGRSYKQKFIFELGAHLAETTTRLDEATSSKIPHTTCKG